MCSVFRCTLLCFVFLSCAPHTQNANNTTNIEQQPTIKTDFYYTYSMRDWLVRFFGTLCCFKCKRAFLRAQSLFSHFYFSSLCEIEFIFAYILIDVWHCPCKVSPSVCVPHYTFARKQTHNATMNNGTNKTVHSHSLFRISIT